MTIPFFPPDLFEDDRQLLLDLVHEIGTAPQQRFLLGEHTARFEEALRTSLGAADVVACSSGTSALTLVLHAMGIGPSDEVVVPAFGCAPLANTVVGLGSDAGVRGHRPVDDGGRPGPCGTSDHRPNQGDHARAHVLRDGRHAPHA